LAKNQNANGMIAVLHTWGQQLSITCIVLFPVVESIETVEKPRTDGKFLFPVKALSKF
jgi:hypothetical protein